MTKIEAAKKKVVIIVLQFSMQLCSRRCYAENEMQWCAFSWEIAVVIGKCASIAQNQIEIANRQFVSIYCCHLSFAPTHSQVGNESRTKKTLSQKERNGCLHFLAPDTRYPANLWHTSKSNLFHRERQFFHTKPYD